MVIAIIGMTTSCGGKKGTTTTDSKDANATKTLTIGLNSDIIAVDPAFAYDNNTNAVVDQITEGLLAYDQNSQLIPNLAKSWKQTDDLTYIYEIRDDVKFSDGTPMTVDDVVFSLQRIKDPTVASYLNWMYASVESITKTGDWEVTVKLSKPDALWQYVPATTAGHIISQKFYNEKKSEFGKPSAGLLGTGPYVFDSWVTGSEIVLKANKNYWDAANTDKNKADVLDYKIVTEGTTLVSALQSGQIDVTMGVPVDQLPTLKSNNNLSIIDSPSFGVDYIAFNTQKKPFNDVNVRKAIYYALDKAQIWNNISKDTVAPANSVIFGEALASFNTEEWKAYLAKSPTYEYDLAKAKEYLAKSSVPNGFDCTLTTNQASIQNSEALLIQTALKELNINVSINKVTEDERVSTFMGGKMVDNKRDYDMIFALWFSDFPDPAGNLNSLYPSGAIVQGGANAAAYSNSKVDELLSAELASSDSGERTKIMQQILDITSDEVPYMILDYPKVIMVVNNRVQNASFCAVYQYNLFFKNFAVTD
jgi:peptide/nickel transport system substrate-binding protein